MIFDFYNRNNKELKEDNKELKIMIKELIKENMKQQEQISELISKIGNNNTIKQITTFNIKIYSLYVLL